MKFNTSGSSSHLERIRLNIRITETIVFTSVHAASRPARANGFLWQLHCVYLSLVSVPSATRPVRLWIHFITIHHL